MIEIWGIVCLVTYVFIRPGKKRWSLCYHHEGRFPKCKKPSTICLKWPQTVWWVCDTTKTLFRWFLRWLHDDDWPQLLNSMTTWSSGSKKRRSGIKDQIYANQNQSNSAHQVAKIDWLITSYVRFGISQEQHFTMMGKLSFYTLGRNVVNFWNDYIWH